MALTFQSVVAAIETRMKANWTETGLAYENVDFTPPTNESWVKIHVIEGDSVKHDLITRVRSIGLVDIQIFTPLLGGAQEARRLAGLLMPIWNRAQVGGIMFRTPSVQRVGDTKDGWYQVNFSVPYYWDETF